MKHIKTYGLIAIALFVFVCLNFRLMRVEKLEIVDVDVNVNDWLEEVVNKEKARSASSSLFIHTRCLTRKNIDLIIK